MKQYEWDEYYEKFNDWSFSTQKTYFNKLTSFGPSDEVTDVIESFGFDDEKVASRCLKRAIETGVKFTTDDVERLIISVDEEILSVVSRSAIGKYTKDQLEMLYGFIDDE